jgi:hypothetical protein
VLEVQHRSTGHPGNGWVEIQSLPVEVDAKGVGIGPNATFKDEGDCIGKLNSGGCVIRVLAVKCRSAVIQVRAFAHVPSVVAATVWTVLPLVIQVVDGLNCERSVCDELVESYVIRTKVTDWFTSKYIAPPQKMNVFLALRVTSWIW